LINRTNSLLTVLAGISYLSRVQESFARQKVFTPHLRPLLPSQSTSVADSVFKSRIKSRIMHWRKGYAEPNKKDDGRLLSINADPHHRLSLLLLFFSQTRRRTACDCIYRNLSCSLRLFLILSSYCAGSLVSSLCRLILGGETYGSRPSISIDVCSDQQVQLVLEVWLYNLSLMFSLK
jgi:poly(A)-specific ribonuclease